MALDSQTELGELIAKNANDISALKEDVVPDDVDQNFLLAPFDGINLSLSVLGVAKFYATDSFIIDHRTQGELDSSTLKLDGGYATSLSGAEFPLTFANNSGLGFAFNEVSNPSTSTLFTYTS